jgi:multicomponent Na+:H+ antiporter subunit C
MTPWQLYASAGVVVFAIALHGLCTVTHVISRVIAANLLGSGIFLILVAISRRAPGVTDPVPQTLVVTGIVVSVSATACALALARRRAELEAAPSDEGVTDAERG